MGPFYLFALLLAEALSVLFDSSHGFPAALSQPRCQPSQSHRRQEQGPASVLIGFISFMALPYFILNLSAYHVFVSACMCHLCMNEYMWCMFVCITAWMYMCECVWFLFVFFFFWVVGWQAQGSFGPEVYRTLWTSLRRDYLACRANIIKDNGVYLLGGSVGTERR